MTGRFCFMRKFSEPRKTCVMDTECYPNYWSIGFRTADGRRKVFELFPGHDLDRQAIAKIVANWRILSFNGIKYDIPMIVFAMSGASNSELKRLNDELIQFGVPHWTALDRLGLRVPRNLDHIDLMQVSPGAPQMPSLKIYAGRLHSKKMQELPVHFDESIDDAKRQIIRAYHGNDLEVTQDLANDLKAQLDIRCAMSDQYGVDLRSKSDAQIAEAVIRAEIERETGNTIQVPEIVPGYFNYDAPSFIKFQTEQLQDVLVHICDMKIGVGRDGIVRMPDYMKGLRIPIGTSVYRMGLGGIHSSEKRTSHYSDDEYVILDRDVTSYYPSIILRCELFPPHIGKIFLKIYRSIYERRLAAKESGDKQTAETLKIVLNGSFGKFGSPFSRLNGPKLMIQTTLTGQLAILMLIESLELEGFSVVSANTDGLVTRVSRARRKGFEAIVAQWELRTKFKTDETEYASLHCRDVNNYIALKRAKDGSIEVKTKGAFAPSGPGLNGAAGQKKNPDMDVCVDAVIAYLRDGIPIDESIEWCIDVRKFLTVRRVTGGAMSGGQDIGKALRWYYSTEVAEGFTIKSSGNAVPQTIGAKLMMTLLPHVPRDMDHAYYVREAYAILQEIGVKTFDPRLAGRSGQIFARLPDALSIHHVNAKTGIAVCGKARDSVRDSWIEYDEVPMNHRLCHKCKKEMTL